MIRHDSLLVFVATIFLSFSSLANCLDIDLNGSGGSSQSMPSSPQGGSANEELKKMIQESGLTNYIPKEFQGCGAPPEKMWYEFLRGLSKIESGGKSCGECGDGGKSCGLFQMTGTDGCGGKKSFGGNQAATKDGKKNVECAVHTWVACMKGDCGGGGGGGSGGGRSAASSGFSSAGAAIKGNKYWGPCKDWARGCPEVVKAVQEKVCNGGGSTDLNWNQIQTGQGGGGQGSPGTQSGKGGRG